MTGKPATGSVRSLVKVATYLYCELQFPLNSSCMTSAVIGGVVLTAEIKGDKRKLID